MIILVDLDGPIADFELHFAEEMDRLTKGTMVIDPAKRDRFHITQQYEELFGPETVDLCYKAVSKPGFYRALSIVPGAKEALEDILTEHHAVICTSPLYANPTCASDKHWWVEHRLGEDWLTRMVITKDKTLVHGDYLIDDKDCITGSLQPTWKQVLYVAPNNVNSTIMPRLTSLSEWRTAVE